MLDHHLTSPFSLLKAPEGKSAPRLVDCRASKEGDLRPSKSVTRSESLQESMNHENHEDERRPLLSNDKPQDDTTIAHEARVLLQYTVPLAAINFLRCVCANESRGVADYLY